MWWSELLKAKLQKKENLFSVVLFLCLYMLGNAIANAHANDNDNENAKGEDTERQKRIGSQKSCLAVYGQWGLCSIAIYMPRSTVLVAY